MSIGGIKASISIAFMLVVWNAPVIICRHLFCNVDRDDNTLLFFDFQKMGSPYVMTGSIAP